MGKLTKIKKQKLAKKLATIDFAKKKKNEEKKKAAKLAKKKKHAKIWLDLEFSKKKIF